MLIKNCWAAMAALLPTLLIASAIAQETAPEIRQDRRENRREGRQDRRENRRENAADTDTTARGNDSIIATMLIPGNQEEIALGQLAEKRSQNPQVKKFAQHMVQDHTKFLNELRRFSGVAAGPAEPAEPSDNAPNRAGINTPNAAEPARVEAPGVDVQAEPGEGVSVDAGGVEVQAGVPPRTRAASASHEHGFDFLAVGRQIHERCLQHTQQMLGQEQGAKFDKCYVGSQVGAHVGMKAKLEVLSEYASPDLQRVLENGLKTTQMHLERARELAMQLDQGGANPRTDDAQQN